MWLVGDRPAASSRAVGLSVYKIAGCVVVWTKKKKKQETGEVHAEDGVPTWFRIVYRGNVPEVRAVLIVSLSHHVLPSPFSGFFRAPKTGSYILCAALSTETHSARGGKLYLPVVAEKRGVGPAVT